MIAEVKKEFKKNLKMIWNIMAANSGKSVKTGNRTAFREYIREILTFYIIPVLFLVQLLSLLHGYSFKDVSIPPEVKTVKIGFIENKARYVNPQLSPRLTDRLQQKITGQTRLTRTNNDDAHYQISGYISQDNITTAGISNQTAATNRLTIGVHITFLNTLTAKTEEFDIRAISISTQTCRDNRQRQA